MESRPTDARPIDHLVELYLLRCRVEGKSESTVHAYRWTLARFIRHLADYGGPWRPAPSHRNTCTGTWDPLRQHVLNARAKLSKDEDSRMRMIKRSPSRKIDLAVAASMAIDRCLYLNV